MTWGLWHAVYALVDAHAIYNRERLLALVTEQRDKHEQPSQSAIRDAAPDDSGGRHGTM